MHEQHGKIDFHLHSYASNVTGYYAANALAIPESYSDPRALYALLKKRGMTLVTLTDHNSIDGVKELLDLGKQDVFASAEMTTTFPKDGCHIHVTVANVTEAQFREVQIETKTRWWESLNQGNQQGASRIMTNNILVTIYTFAFGATFGVGTLFYLAYNGANIASVVALTYRAGFGNDLVTFMAAHGVIELTCIFIAGGAGLLVGTAMIMPGNRTRADALKIRGMEAVRLMLGVALLLVVAGIIEGFVSPAPINPRIKYSVAAMTGIALYSYLLFMGRQQEPKPLQ